MNRMLLAAAALAALPIDANALDDRLPAQFVGDWCVAEHTADHLTFYRRGRCANPDQGEWLTIRPDSFDAHEMHCKVLIARANKRGDYLGKFRCDDNLIQNYCRFWNCSRFPSRAWADRNQFLAMISRFAYLLYFRMCSHILLVSRAYDPPGSTVRISVIKIDYFVMAITSV